MDQSDQNIMKPHLFGENNVVLTALAALFGIQKQDNEKSNSSLNAPFLVLTNVPENDSLLANVLLGSNHSKGGFLDNKNAALPSFEQVHAIATANLIASTQLDIVKQLAEENAQSEHLQTTDNKSSKLIKQAKKERRCKEKKGITSGNSTTKSVSRECLNKLVTDPKALVCSFEGCNRKFAWVNHLKYHELTHTNNRQFRCPDESCGKTFFTSQRLNVHLLTHTGVKPFRCEHVDCGKTFTTAGNLKNHQRIHTGEQPFVCDVPNCNRRFTEQSSLKKHKLTHSGDKPFQCDICGKKFTQSGSRRQHQFRHHLEDEIRNSLKSRKREEKKDLLKDITSNASEDCKSISKTQVLVLDNAYQESVVFEHGINDRITVSTQSINQTMSDADHLSLSHDLLNNEGLQDETLDVKTEDLVVMSDIYSHTDSAGDIVYAADILDHEEVTHASYVSPHVDYSGQIDSYSHHEEIIHASGAAISFPHHDHEITIADYGTDSCISNYETKELCHTFIDDSRNGFIGAEEIAVCQYSMHLTVSSEDRSPEQPSVKSYKSSELSSTLDQECSNGIDSHTHTSQMHNSDENDIHMDPMMECDEDTS